MVVIYLTVFIKATKRFFNKKVEDAALSYMQDVVLWFLPWGLSIMQFLFIPHQFRFFSVFNCNS